MLIISPWNYPFQLALLPLISAIAAGNTVVLKPSELAPNTSNLIKKFIEEIFDRSHALVVEGGADTATKLRNGRGKGLILIKISTQRCYGCIKITPNQCHIENWQMNMILITT